MNMPRLRFSLSLLVTIAVSYTGVLSNSLENFVLASATNEEPAPKAATDIYLPTETAAEMTTFLVGMS